MGCEDGCQIAIRAYPVIVAMAHNHRTVQTDIAALNGRNDFQFGAGEIFFFDTVFLFQQFQNGRLCFFLFTISPDEGHEHFPADGFGKFFGCLIFAEVGEQVIDEKYRVIRGFTDRDVDAPSVSCIDDANQGKRQADPLIF